MKPDVAIGEAARILGVSVDKVRELADSGELQCERTPGGHRRFSSAALESLRKRLAGEGRRSPRGKSVVPGGRTTRPTVARRPARAEELSEADGWDWGPSRSAPRWEAQAPAATSPPHAEPHRATLRQAPEPNPAEEENRLAVLRQYGFNLMPLGIPRSYESEIRDTLDEYVTSSRFPAARSLHEAYDAIRTKVEAILERYNNELAGERRVEELVEYGRSQAASITSGWDYRDREEARDEVLDELEAKVEEDWSERDVADLVDEVLSDWETDAENDEGNGW